MRTLFCWVTALAMVSMLGGCCACRKGKNNLPLTATEWQVVRMMGRDLNFNAGEFVFTFNGDELAGQGACNRIMGKFATTPTGGLKIENLASTRMVCPNSELETEFSQILERATHYEVDGNLLLILSNGEMQAVLQAVE